MIIHMYPMYYLQTIILFIYIQHTYIYKCTYILTTIEYGQLKIYCLYNYVFVFRLNKIRGMTHTNREYIKPLTLPRRGPKPLKQPSDISSSGAETPETTLGCRVIGIIQLHDLNVCPADLSGLVSVTNFRSI